MPYLIFLLLAIVLVALVTVLALIRRFSRRQVQLQLLADSGLFTTGVVIKKNRSSGKQRIYRLHYAFKANNGRRYRSAIAVAPYIWNCYDPGAAIDVAFMPDDPRINSPKYLVNEIRKMMYA